MMEQFHRLKGYAAQERNTESRKTLAQSLYSIHHRYSLEMLLGLAGDSESTVRIAAMNALLAAFPGEDETIRAFVRMAHEDSNPEIRAAVRLDLDGITTNPKASIKDPIELFTACLMTPTNAFNWKACNN